MSIERTEQILRYADALNACYETMLSEEEKRAFHAWEESDEFTRTDFWPGWEKYIGLSPCMPQQSRKVVPMRRRA